MARLSRIQITKLKYIAKFISYGQIMWITTVNDIIVNIPCYDCTKPCAENAKVIE